MAWRGMAGRGEAKPPKLAYHAPIRITRRAASMAWTTQDIDALKQAIATGQLIVRSGDRSLQYRSLSEMREVLRLMEADVAGGPVGLVLGRGKATFRRD
jgi:hypothetical protein